MSAVRYESFTVQGEPGTRDERGAEVIRAFDYGFLEGPRTPEHEVAQLDRFRAERTLLTAAYDDGQSAWAVGAGRPVATFGDYVGSLCVAPGRVVATQMVTEVTVRGTHRRRGILSAMMRGALSRAKEQGLALSALTASEGGIYGRFGFGAAAFSTKVTVRVPRGLELRPEVRQRLEGSGLQVIVPTWEALAQVYPGLFERFQATVPGQTGHTHAYRRRAAGDENPWAMPGAEGKWRPLLVIDAAGEPRGYALTRFQGFEADVTRLSVSDLGALDSLAELALWEAMGATDLVDELVWWEAPDDFFLPWVLINQRDVVTGKRSDHLWVRVLDVVEAFTARGLSADGAVVLEVADRLGLIEGEYTLSRASGQTLCAPGVGGLGVDAPRLRLDAEALGSLYLGTVSVSRLAAVGRAAVQGCEPAELDALFAPARAPRNAYTF